MSTVETESDRLLREHPHLRAWWFLARAYHSMALLLNRFFDEEGITGAQYGVLRCVSDAEHAEGGEGGLRLTDLSRRLMVTGGNITGVVDRLEQAGYLRRERDPDDRRVVLARLTPGGEALIGRLRPRYQDLVRRLTGALTPEEHAHLAHLSERLHRSLEEPAEPEPSCDTALAGSAQDRIFA